MRELIFEGKTFTATTNKGYECLVQGVKMKAWIDKAEATPTQAAKHFHTSSQSVVRKLKLIGVLPIKKPFITLIMIREAIKEHLETGSINKSAIKYNFSEGRLGARMREEGYSLKERG